MKTTLLSFLLVIPSLCYASIEIKVAASSNDDHSSVEYFGNSVELITEQDRNTFKLGDNQLKNAVNSNFGARPDDAYLRSPTPWGDLYTSYGWSQVYTTLSPQSATILRKTSEPVIILKQEFHNNSTKPATFNAAIKQDVANTVTSSWETSGALSIGQSVKYGIDIEVFEASATVKMEYTAKWGQSTSKSETVTVGSSSGVTITLKPGQKVVAELTATRGRMIVKVLYDASLNGCTAINYSTPYKGHHFWCLNIDSVMSSGGISNSCQSSETINIGFYSNAKVIIRDAISNNLMYAIPVKVQ